ncbi:MAG: hypothetical protein QF745_08250, partial [Planctomycetota bacterium]|nr:hypothetical protein [Planctomycetota bacterium]
NSKEKENVKQDIKKDDLQLARPAAMHHRGVTRGETHRQADDLLLKTQRRCALRTREESVQKAMRNARLYITQDAIGTS